MGEETEGLAGGLSKYRSEILALSGVDIMQDENTYKDIYDIFVELAQVWDKMKNDQARARVAEILGGTRQLSGIMSTITNINDAIGAYEGAVNSAGVATEANNIYMETTEAHLKQMQTSFQELSYDLFNSDAIKNGIDMLDTMIGFVDTLVDKFGSLSTILGAAGIAAGIKNVV